MTTATTKPNAARSIMVPPHTWKPIANWLASFLDQDRRRPQRNLPLTQLQAISEQARRHGLRSKRPLRLTMPEDSWNTLANFIHEREADPGAGAARLPEPPGRRPLQPAAPG